MSYAESTKVPVAKSRAEIENIVTRYGATTFASMIRPEGAVIVFEAVGRRIQFELPLPQRDQFSTRVVRGRRVKATDDQRDSAWEQACRQKWRALALVIKAKLEAVDSGITTFEDEFLAHIVLPGGVTVSRWLKPQLAETYETGKMPPLLGAGGQP